MDARRDRSRSRERNASKRSAFNDPLPRDEEERKLFVGNISFDITEKELESHFERFGKISSIRIITDRNSGKPRGFGYVVFSNPRAVDDALREMQGFILNNRELRVDRTANGQGPAPRRANNNEHRDRGGNDHRDLHPRGGSRDRDRGYRERTHRDDSERNAGYSDRRGSYDNQSGGNYENRSIRNQIHNDFENRDIGRQDRGNYDNRNFNNQRRDSRDRGRTDSRDRGRNISLDYREQQRNVANRGPMRGHSRDNYRGGYNDDDYDHQGRRGGHDNYNRDQDDFHSLNRRGRVRGDSRERARGGSRERARELHGRGDVENRNDSRDRANVHRERSGNNHDDRPRDQVENYDEGSQPSATAEKDKSRNVSGRQKICFRFQKGQCPFGDDCIYRHDWIDSRSGKE